ncbi:carboxylating nicotinate-nucleotide diphosphorylase [Deltaproteobacteria bacterium TL4]
MNAFHLQQLIKTSLEEDLAWGDVTSETVINAKWQVQLEILLKQDGVVAGLTVAEQVFRYLDPDLKWMALQQDGTWLTQGTVLASFEGCAQSLLQTERVALNFLQRLSGIATKTYLFVQEARKGSATVRIVDTRKTTPGLRLLEKYAVRMGGGINHRYNLSDAVMLKDNHLSILKKHGVSLSEALKTLRQRLPHTLSIEVEVDSLSQIQEVLDAGADSILLDNMSCDEIRQAVKLIDKRAIIEASGGVTLDRVAEIAATGVDVISVGALTHSSPSLDISLDYKS